MTINQKIKCFLIIKMLKEPKYLGLVFVLSTLMLIIYPVIQILPQGLNNFWFWFSLLTPLRWGLYLLYAILFGTTLSFFFWQRSKKVCSLKKTRKGGILGTVGTLFGSSASLCPACLSWVALILPFSFALSLTKYSLEIMILSILMLLLALWFLGAFRKINILK